jgi:uncharacterized protein YdhG (YjbR/CyaY superfamily)
MTEQPKANSPYGNRKFESVDAYHDAQEPSVRERLELLRQTIHQAVSGLKETISYNMPAFRMRTNLVYYMVHKNHIGFYPTSEPMRVFAERLSEWKHSKGAIQFPHDKPLPLELVRDIVRFRAAADRKEKQ